MVGQGVYMPASDQAVFFAGLFLTEHKMGSHSALLCLEDSEFHGNFPEGERVAVCMEQTSRF